MYTCSFPSPSSAVTWAIGSHVVSLSARTYTPLAVGNRRGIAAATAMLFTFAPLSVESPVLSIVITGICCAVSFTYFTFGTSTSMPNSITCAVSMKMINSTSTTSTNGVTLISESMDPPRPLRDPNPPPPFTDIAICLFSEAALRQVQELQREIVHARPDLPNVAAQNVIEDRRRNRRHQSDSRCDQRLRDEIGRAHV